MLTSSRAALTTKMSNISSPIALSEIEDVLSWVDTFKLSRTTKKINRDFSDAVLLAEILNMHYPKIVEMHNYPPRNSHALKLNNWMTLNRKVLKKLKLILCTDTMDQLANSVPGVIERVLIMVRDKIRQDEEANKALNELEQNISSGGSYYEACGDEAHVLVVPVKTRVNGNLEMTQQKVVSYNAYESLKEELKDAKDATDILKQKVAHLETLLKMKEERIEELQKQLDRKAIRRKETEVLLNSLGVPFESSKSLQPKIIDTHVTASIKSLDSKSIEATKSIKNIKSMDNMMSAENIHCMQNIKSVDLLSKDIYTNYRGHKLQKPDLKLLTPKDSLVNLKIDDADEITHSCEDILMELVKQTSDEEFKDSEAGLIEDPKMTSPFGIDDPILMLKS